MLTQECAKALETEIGKIIVGKKEQITMIIMAVFAGGHVLLDDKPGSGKTTLVKALSLALGCDFRRIQFTPDLLPSDILGMTVFNQKTGEFQMSKGPICTNLLLADEINRAIPRTQSALLEAMEERQVTIDGETFLLPEPFFVMATQNPVERESTFKLPAAQMDRFFVKLSLGYLEKEEEIEMLDHLGDRTPYEEITAVASPEKLKQITEEIRLVLVSDEIKRYIVELVHATRNHPFLKTGASPRASRSLFQGSKSYAAIQGRDYVVPEDIQTIFFAIMEHRISLTSEAKYEKKEAHAVLEDILQNIKVPPYREEWFHES